MPETLTTTDRDRLFDEVALQQAGSVPITSYDAPYSRFDETLPTCAIRQVVPGIEHGRVLWSHPGRSGLDPRAVGPLALVRVADGIGRDRLDSPMTVVDAARWLLDGHVDGWVARPRHRVLVRRGDSTCLYDAQRGCSTHPLVDPLLQDIADVLGDVSFAHCCTRSWRQPHRTVWGVRPRMGPDIAGLARCALDVVRRLGRWYVEGVRGRTAWDLARNGVGVRGIAAWHDLGFTTEEASLWCAFGNPAKAAQLRTDGRWPYRHLTLPPAPAPPDKARGLAGYAQFQMIRHGRRAELRECPLCGSRDLQAPCRTCRREGRTSALGTEWTDYVRFEQLDVAYVAGEHGPPVWCGDRNCRTSLSPSAADEGVRL